MSVVPVTSYVCPPAISPQMLLYQPQIPYFRVLCIVLFDLHTEIYRLLELLLKSGCGYEDYSHRA